MYCVLCGAENPEFASFCKKCGKPVNWKDDQSSTKPDLSEATTPAKLNPLSLPPEPIPAEEHDGRSDVSPDSEVQAIILEAQVRAFEKLYSEMSEEALLHLTKDMTSLTEPALNALKSELGKRGLAEPEGDYRRMDVAQKDEANVEQPTALAYVAKEGSPAASGWARLIIFLLWSVVGLFVFIFLVEAKVAGDHEKFAESITQAFLYSALALWGVSQTFASRYLTIKRTMMVATIFYTIGIGVLAVAFHAPDKQQDNIKQLMSEIASVKASGQDFRQKLEQVIEQDPKTFADFQQRESEMEALLDSDSQRMQEAQSLLKQLQGLSTPNQNSQPTLPLIQRAYEDDSKVFAALREEIACAHVLSRSAASERSQFRKMCLDASQDKIRPLAEDEETIMRELQQQGYKVPSQ